MRLAMGAGRARLVRQLLTETLMLFCSAVLAGAGLARGLTSCSCARCRRCRFPSTCRSRSTSRARVHGRDVVRVGAALRSCAGASDVEGRRGVALKDDAQAPARLRLRHAFVVAQVAFSILLVVVAGLFVRALQAAGAVNPGFDPHGVELASLDLSLAGYTRPHGPASRAILRIAFARCPACNRPASRSSSPAASRRSAGRHRPWRRGAERRALFRRGLEHGRAAILRDAAHSDRQRAGFRVSRSGRRSGSRHRRRRHRAAVLAGEDPIGKFIVQTTVGPGGQARADLCKSSASHATSRPAA